MHKMVKFPLGGIMLLRERIVSNLVRNFIPEKSHKSIMLR